MSSDSGDDQQISTFRKTRKNRESIIEDSDSSSDQDQETCKTPQTTKSQTRRQSGGTRSSERIQKKQSRIFSMPKKEDVWKNIPSTPSSSKVLDHLKPRKIVNDFTKISHRYNHDPLYMDDEGSSLDEFIANDEEIDEDESDDECGDEDDGSIVDSGNESDKGTLPTKPKNQKKRIAGYRKRIQLKFESSDDSSDTEDMEIEERIVKNKDDKTASTKNINQQKITKNDDDGDHEVDDSGSNIVALKRTLNRKTSKNSKISSAKKSKLTPQKSNGDSSDSDIVTPNQSRNKSITESDDESDSCCNNKESTVINDACFAKENQLLNESDFSSDDKLEKLPLNQIIKDCNKETNRNHVNFREENLTSSQNVNSTGICKSGVVLNSDTNQSNKGADRLLKNYSNKSIVHMVESSDSNSESQDCETVDIDDDKKSDSTVEDSNSEEESTESFSSNEDTSEQGTSRSLLQQRKRNKEREKRFEKFKEARERLKTLKSPKDKEV